MSPEPFNMNQPGVESSQMLHGDRSWDLDEVHEEDCGNENNEEYVEEDYHDYVEDDYEEWHESDEESEYFGGDDQSEQHNYPPQKTEIRVDSFDSYIVVSVLTATASFAALLDDSPEPGSKSLHSGIAHDFAIFICAICSLSGIYSTVVFSFSSIYGRAAVGNGKIEVLDTFLKETGPLRYKAFQMYLLSLVLFIALLIFAAVDKIGERLQIPLVGTLVFLSVWSYRDWMRIIVAAGPIFAPSPSPPKTIETSPKSPRRRHRMKLRNQKRSMSMNTLS